LGTYKERKEKENRRSTKNPAKTREDCGIIIKIWDSSCQWIEMHEGGQNIRGGSLKGDHEEKKDT